MNALALTITAKRLAEFCESRQLSAVHLAGELNVNAGGESRADCDAISDWKLDTSVFSLQYLEPSHNAYKYKLTCTVGTLFCTHSASAYLWLLPQLGQGHCLQNGAGMT